MTKDSKLPMTAKGHSAIQNELRHLKSVERHKIIDEISAARALGDLSENAEYHAAREKQGHIEARINYLEDCLRRAQVIDISALGGNVVKFGATVTLVDEETDAKATYQLVGELEADAKNGMISIGSPIARALIGKATGASVQVSLPSGERFYEIVKVIFK